MTEPGLNKYQTEVRQEPGDGVTCPSSYAIVSRATR